MWMGITVRLSAWTVVSLTATLAIAGAQQPEPGDKPPVAQTAPEAQEKDRAKQVQAPPTIPDQQPKSSFRENVGELTKDFLTDQKQIWTSPVHLRLSDTQWLMPLSGITAGLFVTDQDFNRQLSHNPTTISHYKTLSDVGVGALIGGAGGMWVLGHVSHNNHWRETGFLAGEAAINSLVTVEALKYSLGRERPLEGNGSGPFFQGGTSFPSEHAAAAWSLAGVLAHEYPGPLMKIAAYGLATLVDVSRVHGQQHFPSDVLVGSVIGNFIAQDIYSRRHDPALGGAAWSSISQFVRGDGKHTPANMGSPYVPLDSWVYPALERLIALGYIRSAIVGMRPWTRLECARLLNEADDQPNAIGPDDTKAIQLYDSLTHEFSKELALLEGGENTSIQVESIYTRVTGISGEPLTDGNHFGQTITNDYGRPYQEGFNSVDGFSAWSAVGSLVGYVRAEYEHAPSVPPVPLSARQFIASVDNVPGVPPPTPFAAVNRFQLLDGYVGLTILNWQLSFGQQSLWWGPSQGGPLMFSDDVLPLNLFRISRVSPLKLPSILGWLGPMRFEWFLGQQAGHEFVFRTDTGIVGQFGQPISRQPFIQGQKVSLKPTRDFEFSYSLTVLFSGGPTPLTMHYLLKSYSYSNTQQGALNDPGDGRSGVDFSYRIPGLRKWLTFYGDLFSEDEPIPVGWPRKSAYQGGIYMPQIPGIPKLDLRLEGGSTVPADFPGCYGCFYVNNRYPDGAYTNKGNLIGSWLGRAGQGEQAWSTYWLTARSKIQFNFRHQKVSGQYLPSGGTLNDGGVSADFWLKNTISVSGSVQYEKWNFPVLEPIAKSNVTTSVGLTFWPRNWGLPGH